jgi:hypothetical protein
MSARRWPAELWLGMAMAVGRGRDSRIRLALTAAGVGFGVALLLVAASIPAMLAARSERTAARVDQHFGAEQPGRSDGTLLVADFNTQFRGQHIRGRILQPEGPAAPIPPGLDRLPGPGELVVSPALRRLLAGDDAALLRARLPQPIVGEIGEQGLSGAQEHMFYLGSDQLPDPGNSPVRRIDHFGSQGDSDRFPPVLLLLITVGFVVLLLPIGVLIAAVARFGSEQRDRRMAALRLVGADRWMTARIAAGESLAGAGVGILAGALIFLGGRQLIELVTLLDITVFAHDIRPAPALAALIAALVAALAVGVTLLALRRVAIEPLGVVRRAGARRRRLWWRLLLPVAGIALLLPAARLDDSSLEGPPQLQVETGVIALLLGVVALLPWLVEAVVRRLRGGPVAWQLATRRLQLDSGAAGRTVVGIAVAVAGVLALQMLFAAVERNFTRDTGADLAQAQATVVYTPHGSVRQPEVDRRLAATPGVARLWGFTSYGVSSAGDGEPLAFAPLQVADCATLRELIALDSCAAGDVFRAEHTGEQAEYAPRVPDAGERVRLGADGPVVTVPAGARTVAIRSGLDGISYHGLFATPDVFDLSGGLESTVFSYLSLIPGPGREDAYEQVRNTLAAIDPMISFSVQQETMRDNQFDNVSRGLYAGAVALLLLIGASLLVTTLEQLRERRRLLASLIAFGTRRSTLGWSVLWQTAIPVLLGLLLAVVIGIGLGALLLALVRTPVAIDWASIGTLSGLSAAVVLLVTGLSLPLLWRLTRADGLRIE